ncbi:MAG: glycosyltransferase [Clostridia bacterium]|nr:glycosyltransferase [Clostridia bacterium]
MKKILILYAKYGGGHSSAANAIKNYIDNHYKDIETNIVDCIEYINKTINKISTSAYKKITTTTPRLWKKVYYNSEKGTLSKISNGTNKFMARKLYHLVAEYSPDIIISTHMFSSQMISYLKKKNKINCILATILTDFAPHDQWLVGSTYGDYFFVSHEKMRDDLVNKFGIAKNKVYATGIPLSEKFLQNFDKQEIIKSFGLVPDKKIILFFGGGEFGLGKDPTISILTALTKHLDNYQIIAISGKNKKMNEAFMEVSSQLGNPPELKIFDYISNVPEAMSISSLVVTKPGGLTSSESLASSLPILIINPIPGQEEENAEFLEQSGAAIWIKPFDNADLVINNLLNSPDILEKMGENAKKISHIFATRDICDIILNNRTTVGSL